MHVTLQLVKVCENAVIVDKEYICFRDTSYGGKLIILVIA